MNLNSTIRKKLLLLVLIVVLAIYIIINIPVFFVNAGNIFFGNIQKLYNVSLAQNLYLYGKMYSEVTTTKPAPFLYHQLSRTYFIQGDAYTSLAYAYKEIETYPNHIDTYYIIGLTYAYMNNKEKEAIEAFSKYIEAYPKSWAPRNDKAWLQFRTGDIQGALDTIQPVAETHANNPWVQNTYCVLLINIGKYKEALQSCSLAQSAVSTITPEAWGRAYPGNDPRIYSTGISAMKQSVNQNIELLYTKYKMPRLP